MADIVDFANSEGYEFSTEELIAYIDDVGKELTDDELQAVSGGSFRDSTCFCFAGGGGKDAATGQICACVIAGAGDKGEQNYHLYCPFIGNESYCYQTGKF